MSDVSDISNILSIIIVILLFEIEVNPNKSSYFQLLTDLSIRQIPIH